jgi:hypothetical protein
LSFELFRAHSRGVKSQCAGARFPRKVGALLFGHPKIRRNICAAPNWVYFGRCIKKRLEASPLVRQDRNSARRGLE